MIDQFTEPRVKITMSQINGVLVAKEVTINGEVVPVTDAKILVSAREAVGVQVTFTPEDIELVIE